MNIEKIKSIIQKVSSLKISQNAYAILYVVIRDFVQGKLPLRATSLVYTTILSIVPLLALSFSVLKSFGVHNQLQPFLEQTLAPLGAKGVELSTTIVGFVDNIKVGVLGAVGLGFLLFTVVSLIQKIEVAFNDIWHIYRHRSMMQRFTGYLSVVTIGPIVVFSLLGLKTQVTTNPYVAGVVGVTTDAPFFITELIHFIADIAAPIMFFTLANKFIPNTQVKWLPALTAGFITATIWKLAAGGFAHFIQGSVSYDAIYSSFAILLITFIWLYVNWLIVLVGGSFCFYLQNPEQAKLNIVGEEPSHKDILYISLSLLKEITTRHEKGEKPLQLNDFYAKHKCESLIYEAINRLEKGCIISHAEDDVVLLNHTPEKTTLYDVLNILSGEATHQKYARRDGDIMKIMENLNADDKKTTLKKLFG